MKYPFEALFLVCTGERCNNVAHGADRGELLRAELKDHNKRLGRKATVRVCAVSCLDLCDHGPNIVAEPSGVAYSHLNRETARAVYDAETGDGPARPDLELEREEVFR
jgi:(2Fe-2S) ferredoxin